MSVEHQIRHLSGHLRVLVVNLPPEREADENLFFEEAEDSTPAV